MSYEGAITLKALTNIDPWISDTELKGRWARLIAIVVFTATVRCRFLVPHQWTEYVPRPVDAETLQTYCARVEPHLKRSTEREFSDSILLVARVRAFFSALAVHVSSISNTRVCAGRFDHENASGWRSARAGSRS
jgi:hypothetical protein